MLRTGWLSSAQCLHGEESVRISKFLGVAALASPKAAERNGVHFHMHRAFRQSPRDFESLAQGEHTNFAHDLIQQLTKVGQDPGQSYVIWS